MLNNIQSLLQGENKDITQMANHWKEERELKYKTGKQGFYKFSIIQDICKQNTEDIIDVKCSKIDFTFKKRWDPFHLTLSMDDIN
jgi:hypothetical protein